MKIGIRGFTLWEVSIVIVLIGIMGAIAVKPVNGLIRQIRLKNAASALQRLLTTAQSRAIGNSMLHCGVVFEINADPTPDRVFAFFDKTVPPNNVYDAGTDGLYLQPLIFKVQEGIQLTNAPGDNGTTLVYRGDGSAHTSARKLLTLGNFVDTIDVLASTGRVKVTAK